MITYNTYNNIERAILSTYIFDPKTFYVSKLNQDNFTNTFHKNLFLTMKELSNKEEPLDDDFIKILMQKNKTFDEIALLDVLSANPISNLSQYEQKIIEKSTRNMYINEIQKISAIEDISFDEVLNEVKKLEKKLIENNDIAGFIAPKNMKDIEAQTPKFFLRNLLPVQENEITMISSKGGGGKSFIAILIASMLVEIENKKVFAYLSEDSVENTKNRFNKLREIHENMEYFDVWGKENRPQSFVKKSKEGMEASRYFYKFTRYFKAYDVIILDPLIAFIAEDENSNTEARFLFDLLNEWCEKENKTIILLHHHNKDDKTRGASAFVDAVRMHYIVTKKENNDTSRFLKLEKTNHFSGDNEFEIVLFKDNFINKTIKKRVSNGRKRD